MNGGIDQGPPIELPDDLVAKLEALEPAGNLWTPEEDELLRRFYSDKGPTALAPLFLQLHGRSREAIRSRAKRLGLTGKRRPRKIAAEV